MNAMPANPRSPARVHLSAPALTGTELAAIAEGLAAGWLAPAGPVPAAFERAVAEASGFGHACAVSSGTAALHLGMRLLGVAPGEEVWTSALTFIATAAPALQMGARLRFLDVCPRSWTLDPALLAEELAGAARAGRLPRLVVPVDLYGQAADMAAIRDACGRWGVAVLSDSAEALGATQHGQPAGKGAAAAAFSFNGNKIVTTGGGGALVSDDAALVAQARFLAAQAKEPAPHYEHATTGYSYALSSVLASVGLAQIATLTARVAARRARFARYAAGLAGLPGLGLMPEPAWGRSTRWLSVLLIEPEAFGADRDALRRALDAAGIESRPVWKPLHLQPAFRGAPFRGPGHAERLFAEGLCLPSGEITAADQDRVIAAIHGVARR